MRNALLQTTAFLVISSMSFVTNAQTVEQVILDLEHARIEALMARDSEIMDKILSPNLVHVTSAGLRRNKTDYLKAFVTSKKRFAKFELGEVNILVHGDIVTVTGDYSNIEAIEADAQSKSAWFTRIYQKNPQGWQLIVHQATKKAK